MMSEEDLFLEKFRERDNCGGGQLLSARTTICTNEDLEAICAHGDFLS